MISNNDVKSLAERIMRLEKEKSEIAEAIKDVYIEAKGKGFDVSALKKAIAIAGKERDSEKMELVNLYLQGIGELPLFDVK